MIRKKRKPPSDKRLGKMLTKKGPSRDAAHLESVRQMYCIICWGGQLLRSQYPLLDQKSEAHHVRCVGPRTMGKRVSDYWVLPLCTRHHAKLHTMNEADFWMISNIRPAEKIALLSEAGRREIEAIRGVVTAGRP